MDVLTEFELKYFESKDLLGGIQHRLAAFADDSLDEKSMDERAKKKVDQLWENHSAAKKEGRRWLTEILLMRQTRQRIPGCPSYSIWGTPWKKILKQSETKRIICLKELLWLVRTLLLARR